MQKKIIYWHKKKTFYECWIMKAKNLQNELWPQSLRKVAKGQFYV